MYVLYAICVNLTTDRLHILWKRSIPVVSIQVCQITESMHTSALGYKMKNLCFGRFFCHFVSNIMSDTGSNDWCVESVVGDSYHLGSLGKIGIDGDGCDEEDVFDEE